MRWRVYYSCRLAFISVASLTKSCDYVLMQIAFQPCGYSRKASREQLKKALAPLSTS